MIYAYVTNSSKSIDFNMYCVNQLITTPTEYTLVKCCMLPVDSLLIEECSLLGNTIMQVLKELNELRERGINFTLLDNPLINSQDSTVMDTVAYLSTVNLGKELKMGRPEANVPVKFDKLYRMYLSGETQKAIQLSGLSRATFYRRLAKYEREHGYSKRRNSKATEYGKTLQNFNLDTRTLEQYPLLKL